MSLDEIIATQKKTGGGGVGRKFGRGRGRGGRGTPRVAGGVPMKPRRNFSNGRAPYARAVSIFIITVVFKYLNL